MSAIRTGTVRICEGVDWESVQTTTARSYFPEFGLEQLAATGLDKILTSANIRNLRRRLGERISTSGDTLTEVRALKENDQIVVKLSRGSFSNTAVNAALEAGFGNDPQYGTPTYFGALFLRGGQSATIMSRVDGKPLAAISSFDEENHYRYLPLLKEKIKNAGYTALHNVGVNPALIFWDLQPNNMFVPRNLSALSEAQDARLTIIDQTSNLRGGATEWSDAARSRDGIYDLIGLSSPETAGIPLVHPRIAAELAGNITAGV